MKIESIFKPVNFQIIKNMYLKFVLIIKNTYAKIGLPYQKS